MRFLLCLFILIPVVEMWILIEVGSIIGAWPTIALVLLSAVIGSSLLRRQSLRTLIRGRQKLDQGQLPAEEMVEGLILAVSGALLLTPGFVTDIFGLLGLIPFTRTQLVRRLMAAGTLRSFGYTEAHFRGSPPSQNQHTIEGEYWRKDKDNNNS